MSHPDLLVGPRLDDAGVFRLSEKLALVQTVDFFTPIVDEAYDWGRIAAANALSDVYAMGGRPLTALQIVGWPREGLPLDLLGEVFQGGAAVLAEAECLVVGGHTVDDPEPKYGLAVTGVVDPSRLVRSQGAKPGDLLVLTKPIGSGIISTAIKRGVASKPVRDRAVEVMAVLNAGAAEAMSEVGVDAATDVTGFGLLGHLRSLLEASGVGAGLQAGTLPLLPGARELAEAGVFPDGSRRNLEYASGFTEFGEAPEWMQMLLADAQTSGGLLVAVAAARADQLLAALAQRSTPAAVVIGEVREQPGVKVR